MARKKSKEDLREQALKLYAASKGNAKRKAKIQEIYGRYIGNINKTDFDRGQKIAYDVASNQNQRHYDKYGRYNSELTQKESDSAIRRGHAKYDRDVYMGGKNAIMDFGKPKTDNRDMSNTAAVAAGGNG